MSLTDIPAADFADLYLSAHQQEKTARRTRGWTIPMLKRLRVSGGPVLSVGCASGADILELRDHGYDAYGIDLYEPCKAARAWCRLATTDSIPFEDGRFSAVVMLEVIEHIPVSQRSHAAQEIARVLKNGGVLLLATPNRYFPVDEHGEPLRFHSPFKDETLTTKELEALFHAPAESLTWSGYFQLERFGWAGKIINPCMRVFDNDLLHRSPLNPHLFLGFKFSNQPPGVKLNR
jgi:SAM-dependent methyltransferase